MVQGNRKFLSGALRAQLSTVACEEKKKRAGCARPQPLCMGYDAHMVRAWLAIPVSPVCPPKILAFISGGSLKGGND